jgi:hypothetical protein
MPSRHGLQRAGFMGQVTKFGEGDGLRGLLEAIRAADYAAARRVDVGFRCIPLLGVRQQLLRAVLADRAARIRRGFYDCTRAVCPQGHEQVVDD